MEDNPESPPTLSPTLDDSDMDLSKFNTPSITQVPFHLWLHAMTDPKSGPYPNGMHVKRIRDIIDRQWSEEMKNSKKKDPKKFGFWKRRSEMYTVLGNAVKAGRAKRISKGVYVGLDKQQGMESEQRIRKWICSLCTKKHRTAGNAYLQCTKCEERWHMTCARNRSYLPADFLKSNLDAKTLASKLQSIAPDWTCYSCKLCKICQRGEEPENLLLICDHCDSSEHFNCQNPRPESVPYSPWYCTVCRQAGIVNPTPTTASAIGIRKIGKITKNIGNTGELDRYGLPPLRDHPLMKDIRGKEIPDWNVDKTSSLFQSMGLNRVAEIFKDQEIDGAALLLLAREDLMCKLNLKLGSALKAFRIVWYLQKLHESASKKATK